MEDIDNDEGKVEIIQEEWMHLGIKGNSDSSLIGTICFVGVVEDEIDWYFV